jgi:hypothetical protein
LQDCRSLTKSLVTAGAHRPQQRLEEVLTMALFLFLILVAIVLGIIGAVAEGLFYLLRCLPTFRPGRVPRQTRRLLASPLLARTRWAPGPGSRLARRGAG